MPIIHVKNENIWFKVTFTWDLGSMVLIHSVKKSIFVSDFCVNGHAYISFAYLVLFIEFLSGSIFPFL
jgi:hypothetical protein